MATIYKVEICSDYINYPKEELQKLLEKAMKTIEEPHNTIRVEVQTRS
jgi:hypothetical protein